MKVFKITYRIKRAEVNLFTCCSVDGVDIDDRHLFVKHLKCNLLVNFKDRINVIDIH